MTLGVGTWLVLVLLATIMASTPVVAQARVVSEAGATSGGFDCAEVTQIPQSECEVLAAFYYATGGDGWYNSAGWLVTNTPCDWNGITCDGGHVSELVMTDNNLVGSIPPELASLSQLRVLSFGGDVSGVIPPEFGTLSQLETLGVRHNYEVSIPPELGNLSNLVELQITAAWVPTDPSEQLRDGCATLPPELGNLSNLQALDISFSVCGSIPPELGDLSNLQVLDLGGNYGLSGSIPPELGNLSNLQWIALNHTGLSGTLPPELGNLTNLTHLLLSWGSGDCFGLPPWQGSLTGPLPPELGNLTNLQVLDLYCQAFTGPLPMSFINLLQLDRLDYLFNYLCEPPDPAFQDWIAGVQNVSPSPGILCEPTSLPLYLPLVAR